MQLLLLVAGGLLVLSGAVHSVVWLFSSGDWEGPVSLRKPILFGLSTGATVLSIAWLYPKLQPQKWDAAFCGLFGISMIAEVALITMQYWRGVASHFNHSTLVDTQIENWMTYLIVFATVFLVEFTRRCFFNLNAPSDLKLAIRGGMTFLIASCLIGFAILFHGNSQAAIGADPSTYGEAGVTKFPHGVAIHAIQFFPLACWLLMKAGIPLEQRTRLIGYLIASTAAFLMFSIVQTLSGKGRFDMTTEGALLIVFSTGCLLPLVWTLAVRLLRRQVRSLR